MLILPVASFLLSCAVRAEDLVAEARQVAPTALQIVDAVEPEVYAVLRCHLPALKLVQVLHVTGHPGFAQMSDGTVNV